MSWEMICSTQSLHTSAIMILPAVQVDPVLWIRYWACGTSGAGPVRSHFTVREVLADSGPCLLSAVLIRCSVTCCRDSASLYSGKLLLETFCPCCASSYIHTDTLYFYFRALGHVSVSGPSLMPSGIVVTLNQGCITPTTLAAYHSRRLFSLLSCLFFLVALGFFSRLCFSWQKLNFFWGEFCSIELLVSGSGSRLT